jgi:hypothetical protein
MDHLSPHSLCHAAPGWYDPQRQGDTRDRCLGLRDLAHRSRSDPADRIADSHPSSTRWRRPEPGHRRERIHIRGVFPLPGGIPDGSDHSMHRARSSHRHYHFPSCPRLDGPRRHLGPLHHRHPSLLHHPRLEHAWRAARPVGPENQSHARRLAGRACRQKGHCHPFAGLRLDGLRPRRHDRGTAEPDRRRPLQGPARHRDFLFPVDSTALALSWPRPHHAVVDPPPLPLRRHGDPRRKHRDRARVPRPSADEPGRMARHGDLRCDRFWLGHGGPASHTLACRRGDRPLLTLFPGRAFPRLGAGQLASARVRSGEPSSPCVAPSRYPRRW